MNCVNSPIESPQTDISYDESVYNCENIQKVLDELNDGRNQVSKISIIKDVGEIEITTDDSVSLALVCMDSRYKTNFREFIIDPRNMDLTVVHLRPLLPEYLTPCVGRALRAITKGWNILAVASLLIKLYYKEGMMGNPRFSNIANELCVGRSEEDNLELISTLIIGENAENTAIFIKRLTNSWNGTNVITLIHQISENSQWSTQFYECFLLSFAACATPEVKVCTKNIVFVRECLEQRRKQKNLDPASNNAFFKRILQRLLLGEKHKTAIELKTDIIKVKKEKHRLYCEAEDLRPTTSKAVLHKFPRRFSHDKK